MALLGGATAPTATDLGSSTGAHPDTGGPPWADWDSPNHSWHKIYVPSNCFVSVYHDLAGDLEDTVVTVYLGNAAGTSLTQAGYGDDEYGLSKPLISVWISDAPRWVYFKSTGINGFDIAADGQRLGWHLDTSGTTAWPEYVGYAAYDPGYNTGFPLAQVVYSGPVLASRQTYWTRLTYTGRIIKYPADTAFDGYGGFIAPSGASFSKYWRAALGMWDNYTSLSSVSFQYWWWRVAAYDMRLVYNFMPTSSWVDPVIYNPTTTVSVEWEPGSSHGGHWLSNESSSDDATPGPQLGEMRYYQDGDLALATGMSSAWTWSVEGVAVISDDPRWVPFIDYVGSGPIAGIEADTVGQLHLTLTEADPAATTLKLRASGHSVRPTLTGGSSTFPADPVGSTWTIPLSSLTLGEDTALTIPAGLMSLFADGTATGWEFTCPDDVTPTINRPVAITGWRMTFGAAEEGIGQWWPRHGEQASLAGVSEVPSIGQSWPRGNR